MLWAMGSVPGGWQGQQRVALGKQVLGRLWGMLAKQCPWGWRNMLGLEAGGEAGSVGTNRIGKCWSSVSALPPSLHLQPLVPRLSGASLFTFAMSNRLVCGSCCGRWHRVLGSPHRSSPVRQDQCHCLLEVSPPSLGAGGGFWWVISSCCWVRTQPICPSPAWEAWMPWS